MFQFSNVVVVEGNLIGVIVKSWVGEQFSHEVYVRSFNAIKLYSQDEIKHFVFDKELSDESMEYQN